MTRPALREDFGFSLAYGLAAVFLAFLIVVAVLIAMARPTAHGGPSTTSWPSHDGDTVEITDG